MIVEESNTEENLAMLDCEMRTLPKIVLTVNLNSNANKIKEQEEDDDEEEEESETAMPTSTKKGLINQILITCSILLLAAACGMPIGYSAVLLPQLYNDTEPLMIDIEMGSWIASVHSLATPLGSLVSGPISDKFGRRKALLFTILPLFTGWSLIALASSHAVILLGRVVAGVAVGLTAAPAQILLAEIAEPHLRGILIGAPFVSYSLGILLVYALGSTLHWREVAWAGIVLPMFSCIAILLSPESPTWLARNNRLKEASKALSWLRGGDIAAKLEMQHLTTRIEKEKNEGMNDYSIWKSLKQVSLIKPLVIINGFHVLQILSGTYIIVFYAVDIISDLGGVSVNTLHAAVLTALVRLLFTVLFCFLLHSLNRRTMILGSGIGSAISCLVLSAYMFIRLGKPAQDYDLYVSATLILIYIGSNTGFMVMPGIMVGELLPAQIRGQIAGYIFALFNIGLFGVAKLFPYAKETFKTQGLFFIFGISSLCATALLYALLPETRQRTLHDIEDYFHQKNWMWINRKKKDNKKNCYEDEKKKMCA